MLKIHREKARWELQKNVICCFERILKATPTKQQLYSHFPLISKPIQVKQTRYPNTAGEARINS